AAGIKSGPVFRAIFKKRISSDPPNREHVTNVIKRAAVDAGLDPKELSAHSLRAGFVTAAALAKRSYRSIRKTTGHQSDFMVDRYVRVVELFDDENAGGLLSSVIEGGKV